ncbi:hypothetical protein GCK32_006704, partial [Trichostrongylus colubriformis]
VALYSLLHGICVVSTITNAHMLPGPSVHRNGNGRVTNLSQGQITSLLPLAQKTRWHCRVCGKSLSSKRSYDEHMNIHNDARPFACEHCDYAAASQMTLRRHKLRSHTSRRDWGYRCPYCYEAYMEPASYQQHIQSRHYGRSATFGCPYMECTFQSKCFRHFREHLAKHRSYESYLGQPNRVPFSFPDNELDRFLVDDEYGDGFRQNGGIRTIQFVKGHPANTPVMPRDTIVPVKMVDTCDSPPLLRPEVTEEDFMKEPIKLPPSVPVFVADDVMREPIRLRRSVPTMTSGDLMKEPIRLRPSVPKVAVPRRVIHQVPECDDVKPPKLEVMLPEMYPADSDWIEGEVEVRYFRGIQLSARTKNGYRLCARCRLLAIYVISMFRPVMFHCFRTAKWILNWIRHGFPSVVTLYVMDMGVLAPAIDLQIADDVIEEVSQVDARSSSSPYTEVRTEVDEEGLRPWPRSSSNQLKLSVGGEDSQEEDDDYNDLRHSIHMWHLHLPETEEFAAVDPDVGLSVERVQSIIAGQGLLFTPLNEGSFVEEVFSEKGPKSHNGYLFGAKIGEGSYAKVKEVVDETTLVRRAVKIIKHNRLRKIQNGQENVERELRILNRVRHENVIRLIEVFRRENKNKLYVVLEFCMGSVQQLLDTSYENRLCDADTHRYFVDLIKGLEYLHSVGIVHKDIKPANLLVSLDYTLKISDFGVAEELPLYQKDDSCQVVQGTPKFQAPELVSGNTEYYSGFASDLWSCGVTLYNMISGLYPFEGAVGLSTLFYFIYPRLLLRCGAVAVPL